MCYLPGLLSKRWSGRAVLASPEMADIKTLTLAVRGAPKMLKLRLQKRCQPWFDANSQQAAKEAFRALHIGVCCVSLNKAITASEEAGRGW